MDLLLLSFIDAVPLTYVNTNGETWLYDLTIDGYSSGDVERIVIDGVDVLTFESVGGTSVRFSPPARVRNIHPLRLDAYAIFRRGVPTGSAAPVISEVRILPNPKRANPIENAVQRAWRILVRPVEGDPLRPGSGGGILSALRGREDVTRASNIVSQACAKYNSSVRPSSSVYVRSVRPVQVSYMNYADISSVPTTSIISSDARVLRIRLSWAMSDGSVQESESVL